MGVICKNKKEFFDALFYIMSDGEYQDGDFGGEDEWEQAFADDIYVFFGEYDNPAMNVMVDLENIGVEGYCKGGLHGFGVAPGGGVFFAFGCGGDWECPVNAILYKEDGNIRMYAPEKGNFFNEKTRRAYGNEAGEENMFEKAKYSRREQLKDIGRYFASCDPLYVAGKGAKAFETLREKVEAGDANAVDYLRKNIMDAVKSCDAGRLLKIYSLIKKED